jgi:hypothetical protein
MKGVRMGEKVRQERANKARVARYSVPSRRRISHSSVIRSSIMTRRVRLRVGGFWRKLRRLQRDGVRGCRRESGDTLRSRYRFLSVQVCILAMALWVSYPSCASPTVARCLNAISNQKGFSSRKCIHSIISRVYAKKERLQKSTIHLRPHISLVLGAPLTTNIVLNIHHQADLFITDWRRRFLLLRPSSANIYCGTEDQRTAGDTEPAGRRPPNNPLPAQGEQQLGINLLFVSSFFLVTDHQVNSPYSSPDPPSRAATRR